MRNEQDVRECPIAGDVARKGRTYRQVVGRWERFDGRTMVRYVALNGSFDSISDKSWQLWAANADVLVVARGRSDA